MRSEEDGRAAVPDEGTPREVFGVFLKLGLTSFGGPIAHLGYFRDELVTRRRWLSDGAYADLVALCQFLPGPASSQVGFALGLMRAGWLGALAAFTAFTLPSALILLVFAMTAASISGPVGTGALDGLKIVAVAIVAQAVLGHGAVALPGPREGGHRGGGGRGPGLPAGRLRHGWRHRAGHRGGSCGCPGGRGRGGRAGRDAGLPGAGAGRAGGLRRPSRPAAAGCGLVADASGHRRLLSGRRAGVRRAATSSCRFSRRRPWRGAG
jgi:chromate transporter